MADLVQQQRAKPPVGVAILSPEASCQMLNEDFLRSHRSGIRTLVVTPLLAACLLLLTQCGSQGTSSTTSGSTGASTPSVPAISVAGERYDHQQTGANTVETVLTPASVGSGSFGKLWSYTVDGTIQAQPLYQQGISVQGAAHNAVFVGTMNDVLYAFDADSSATLWVRDFRNPSAGVTAVPVSAVAPSAGNLTGSIGIESTPVIDTTTGTLYVVTRTLESGTVVARLHAIDVTSGNDTIKPAVIQASVAGTGGDSAGGMVPFDPAGNQSRAGLALVNGQVIIAWSIQQNTMEDVKHGWVMAYSEASLQQTAAFCVTPNAAGGGVWMAGRAPAIDANGNVYVQTGNGLYDGTSDYGDSLLKFSTANNTLTLSDWFTPQDQIVLDEYDVDLGSGGPLLVPGTTTVLGGGKQGMVYALNTQSLGHLQVSEYTVEQQFLLNGAIFSGPVFWQEASGSHVYVWANNDVLKGSTVSASGSSFQLTEFSESTMQAPQGYSGGVLTLSANGSQTGTGIVWASMPLNSDGLNGQVQGVLRAFNADDLSQEVWDSNMNAARDNSGNWPKYSAPLVANGRVYMASFSNVVNVYGLLK